MKLVIAIVHRKDADPCVDSLTASGYVCTRFESAGGFLDKANTTLMIGVDDPMVEKVLELLSATARRRHETLAAPGPVPGPAGLVVPAPVDVEVGGATVFVVPIERFEKL